MQASPRQRFYIGLICVAGGIFLIVVAGEWFDNLKPQPNDAPNAIIALAGLVFVIAGLMVFVGQQSRMNDILAAILCAIFGVMGVWVAFISSDHGFSGGIPFVSRETHIIIGRAMFGLGSIISFALSIWALRRFVSNKAAKEKPQ